MTEQKILDMEVLKAIAEQTGTEQGEVFQTYLQYEEQFKAEFGSCLDAENYTEHWNKRIDYALEHTREHYKR